jgi:large subunit ribosomal protein L13
MIIVDAEGSIAGRLATYVAKQALLGNSVSVVNSEKAVISGRKENTFDKYLTQVARGTPRKGPFVQKYPHKILRRVIRGMVPFKKTRGREAYERVLCYIGIPDEFQGKKMIKVPGADMKKLPTLNYVDLLTLSKRLGAKLE